MEMENFLMWACGFLVSTCGMLIVYFFRLTPLIERQIEMKLAPFIERIDTLKSVYTEQKDWMVKMSETLQKTQTDYAVMASQMVSLHADLKEIVQQLKHNHCPAVGGEDTKKCKE